MTMAGTATSRQIHVSAVRQTKQSPVTTTTRSSLVATSCFVFAQKIKHKPETFLLFTLLYLFFDYLDSFLYILLDKMPGIAQGRLAEERKAWRKDHPIGFYARPSSKDDGSSDIMVWEAGIPGKEETDWAGGVYKVRLEFSEEYPSKPPKCKSGQCVAVLVVNRIFGCREKGSALRQSMELNSVHVDLISHVRFQCLNIL